MPTSFVFESPYRIRVRIIQDRKKNGNAANIFYITVMLLSACRIDQSIHKMTIESVFGKTFSGFCLPVVWVKLLVRIFIASTK
jgi:hypothetical protein